MQKILLKLLGSYINVMTKVAPGFGAKQGAMIFSYPVRPKMKPKHKAYLLENKAFDLMFDHKKVAVYKWGTGPKKVVMVHGWQSHSYRWKKYIDQMDLSEYTIYAFDGPGHGLSEGYQMNLPIYGNILHILLKRINGADILIGHSLGAINCLYTLYEYNIRSIKKLIVMASPGEASDFGDSYKKELGVTEETFEKVLQYFEEKYGYSLSYFSAAKFAEALDMEGIIIHDADDKIALPKYAKAIHESWPESELILTKGFGHNLNRPEVIEKTLRFLN